MSTVDAVKGTSGEQGPLMHCGGCRRELVTQTPHRIRILKQCNIDNDHSS